LINYFSNVHLQLVCLLPDGPLYCFCLLAESYETINQTINPKQCLPQEAKKTIPQSTLETNQVNLCSIFGY